MVYLAQEIGAKRSGLLRHLSINQRVWVGVCLAATLPFFLRDLAQLPADKTPPILSGSLPSPLWISNSHTNIASIGDKSEIRLEEVRTIVGNGYPAWKPYTTVLPEVAPTGQVFRSNMQSPPLLPSDQMLRRFAIRWTGQVDEHLPALIRSDVGVNGDDYVPVLYDKGNLPAQHSLCVWRMFMKNTQTTNIDAGLALTADTQTLAQFPVPGSLGVSYGIKAVWAASNDSDAMPVRLDLAPNRRPVRAGTYLLKSYTIDQWGMKRLVDFRVTDLLPKTASITLPLTRFPSSYDAQAVRVTITPYRWTRFADVPLTIPGRESFRLNPLPITASIEKERQAVIEGGSGAVGDYRELFRIPHNALTHPQLIQSVPHSVLITHTRQSFDATVTEISRAESYFRVFLPPNWNDVRTNVTLYAITKTGKRIRALAAGSSEEGKSIRLDFQLSGVPYDDVAEVSFGLTR